MKIRTDGTLFLWKLLFPVLQRTIWNCIDRSDKNRNCLADDDIIDNGIWCNNAKPKLQIAPTMHCQTCFERVFVFPISCEDMMDEDKSIIVLWQKRIRVDTQYWQTDKTKQYIKVISITRTQHTSEQTQTYMWQKTWTVTLS